MTLPRRFLALLALLPLAAVADARARSAPATEPAPAAPGPGRALPLRVVSLDGREAVGGEALVHFRGDATPGERAAALAARAGRELRDLRRGWFHVAFDGASGGDALTGALEALRGDPRVLGAEPNWLRYPAYTPDDPAFAGGQWGLTQVGAGSAWSVQRGDAAVVVAVIDSGVDVDHPDLVGQLAWGHDFYANDDDPDDHDGHGTHVAGIAAAETDNGTGVAGMGFECRLAAYRCGDGAYPLSDTIASINDAVARGAHVLNLSYGSSAFSVAERDALKAAHQAGCVNVAAAGNGGSDEKHYPAAYARVLAVANSNAQDGRHPSSNYGPWVDVAAPGAAIYSTDLAGGYSHKWGTSMASPLVAGLAGLLYAELGGVRSEVNATRVRDAIEQSSIPQGFVEFGRVDALAALLELSPPGAPVVTGFAEPQVDAFFTPTLTLLGSGFASATEVEVAGAPYGPGAFQVVDDGTLALVLPDAAALGPVDVAVTTAGGSAGATFERVETSPPAVKAPPLGVPGTPLPLEWAGGADDLYLLVLAPDPATVPVPAPGGSHEVLAGLQVGRIGALDAVGHEALTLPSLGSFGFLTVYLQVLTVDGASLAFAGASPVASLTLL